MKNLNWSPKIDIKNGIENTINWYLEYKDKLKEIEFKFEYEK